MDSNIEPSLQQLSFPATAHPPPLPEQESRKRKRRRKVLVCEPCHRHKQKCDRGEPCSRCVASDRVSQCVYTQPNGYVQDQVNAQPNVNHDTIYGILSRHNQIESQLQHQNNLQDLPWSTTGYPSQDAANNPGLLLAAANALEQAGEAESKEVPSLVYEDGKIDSCEPAYFAKVAFQIDGDNSYLNSTSTTLSQLTKRHQAIGEKFKMKPRSFPFGAEVATSPYPEETRLGNLPARQHVQGLVDNYLSSIEKLYPLLDAPKFRQQIHDWYEAPVEIQTSELTSSWLAKLYLVLALGHHVNPPSSASERAFLQYRDQFLDGAESCLEQSSLFLHAGAREVCFDRIQAMCMIIIAQQLGLVSIDNKQIWVLMGFISRSAMMLYMHIDPATFPEMAEREAETSKRIWTTILQLDLVTAAAARLPVQCHIFYCSTPAPKIVGPGTNHDVAFDPEVCRFQQKVRSALSLFFEVVMRTNPSRAAYSRKAIMDLDQKLANLLDENENLTVELDTEARFAKKLHQVVFGNLIRRMRLDLHWHSIRRLTAGSVEFQNSCVIANESAIGLLSRSHALYEDDRLQWACQLFHNDMYYATIQVGVGLRQGFQAQQLCETAEQALNYSIHLCDRNIHKSLMYTKFFIGFHIMRTLLLNANLGDRGVPEDAFVNAANEAISRVEMRLQQEGNGVPDTKSEEMQNTAAEVREQSDPPTFTEGQDGLPTVTSGSIDPALDSNGHVHAVAAVERIRLMTFFEDIFGPAR